MAFTSDEAVKFLTANPFIRRLNFSFLRYKVYPSAYYADVANAIRSGDIKIHLKKENSRDVPGSYDPGFDSLDVVPDFNIGDWQDQAYLVHECTHAHLDIQNLGRCSGYENEAVAFLAEAVFLEASHKQPLGTQSIRTVSHRLAKDLLLNSVYTVPQSAAAELVAEVKKHPHYSSKVYFISNGFNRSMFQNLARWKGAR